MIEIKNITKEENDFIEEMRRVFPNVSQITLELFVFKLQDIRISATQRGFDEGLKKGNEEAKHIKENMHF